VVLKIEAPQLRKKAQTPCRHLISTGCGIYAARPGVCRQFLCGWRLFAELEDDWRPDLSGVLMMRKAPAELPAAWRGAPYGVHLDVTGGEAAITRAGFADYVARLMTQGIPVFLSAASPSTLVNEHLNGKPRHRTSPACARNCLRFTPCCMPRAGKKASCGPSARSIACSLTASAAKPINIYQNQMNRRTKPHWNIRLARPY
jgi:hypothetical protein